MLMSEVLPAEVEIAHFTSAISDERKALVFAEMQPGSRYTAGDMHSLVRGVEGPDSPWPTSSALIATYLKSYAAVDLVCVNGDRDYRTSQRGSEIGQPLAGHLLGLSLDIDPSLKDFGGSMNTTNANGSRPIQNRIGIFRRLSEIGDDWISITRLGEDIGSSTSRIAIVAANLETVGLITKLGSDKGEPVVHYRPTSKLDSLGYRNPDTTETYKQTLALLQDHFKQNPDDQLSNYDIVALLKQHRLSDLPSDQLFLAVGKITSSLWARRDALEPVRVSNNSRDYAVVTTTPQQRQLIDAYLELIDGAINGDEQYKLEGRKKIYQILSDEGLVAELYRKAQRSSSGWLRSAEAQEQIVQNVDKFVSNQSSPFTIRQAVRGFTASGLGYGYRMVRNHFERLVDEGKLSKRKTNRGWEYTPIGYN